MSETGLDPRSVANAIIDLADRRSRAVTHLAVQKLLYFAHGSYLRRYKLPLVFGVFEAWEHGPVCRPIYDALKHHGRAPIRELISERNPFTRNVRVVPFPTSAVVLNHLDMLIHTHGHLTASQLRDLSHAEGGPWSIVWEKAKSGVTLGNRIDDDLTVERFGRFKISLKVDAPAEDPDEASPVAGD